ncbi:hypothetical protein GCK32_008365 [Trichostrongylus colubriformis]|uniref:Uncharacterized protein n=1 Tax=Trichostrongylus colubriformis TaxID=6319 RepID=A0AAN8IPV0_TRICO
MEIVSMHYNSQLEPYEDGEADGRLVDSQWAEDEEECRRRTPEVDGSDIHSKFVKGYCFSGQKRKENELLAYLPLYDRSVGPSRSLTVAQSPMFIHKSGCVPEKLLYTTRLSNVDGCILLIFWI